MIARWKPVHLGHAAALKALAARGEEVLVGIGSSNRRDARNPFTAVETREMLQLVLDGVPNVTLLDVPDLDDGPRWRAMVVELFGRLDAFVTANPYVARLLADDYPILRPVDLVAPSERVAGRRHRGPPRDGARGGVELTGSPRGFGLHPGARPGPSIPQRVRTRNPGARRAADGEVIDVLVG